MWTGGFNLGLPLGFRVWALWEYFSTNRQFDLQGANKISIRIKIIRVREMAEKTESGGSATRILKLDKRERCELV